MTADLATWGFVTSRLALETVLIAGLAAVVVRFASRAATRRSLWQSALVGIAILWAGELLDLRPVWQNRTDRHATAASPAASVSAHPSGGIESALAPRSTILGPRQTIDSPAATTVSESTTPGSFGGLAGTSLDHRHGAGPGERSAHTPSSGAMDAFPSTPGNAGHREGWRVRECGSQRTRPEPQFLDPSRRVESPELCGPVAFGVWRPTIALPTQFSRRFTSSQRDAMVAHELAHLRGRDPLWCLLADVLCAIAWWHPAVWWVRDRFRAAAESAADAAAASTIDGGHVALAEALVTWAATWSMPADSADWAWWAMDSDRTSRTA